MALVALALAYTHQLSESVRSHPECALRAVREHCRFMVGRQLREGLGRHEFEERMQACDDFRIRDIAVRGGLLRPVIVRIALDPQQPLPLGKDVFIFRSDLWVTRSCRGSPASRRADGNSITSMSTPSRCSKAATEHR